MLRRLTAGLALAAGAALAVSALAVPANAVSPAGKARGATTVTLDAGTIGAVVGLGLSPAAAAPGVLGGDPLKASFPIVGNSKGGIIKHTGGLTLTGGEDTLALTNYWIDTNEGVLTAAAALNGDGLGRIPLFELGSAPASSACAASASLALTSDAAEALTMIFGAPNLTGADFGDACVAPR
jgi:hypothetical protein